MNNPDIRWHQRLNNFNKAFSQLTLFIEKADSLNMMEEQGLIKAFEYTYELSWNLIKDYYEYQGVTDIQGSRDSFRLAFNRGLIENGTMWMKMIESRIKTSHTYNEATADEIAELIIHHYFGMFKELQRKMEFIKDNELN